MPNMTDVEERAGKSLLAMEHIKTYLMNSLDLCFSARGESGWSEVRAQAMQAYGQTQTLMHEVVAFCEELGAKGLAEHAATMRMHTYTPIRGMNSPCAVCRDTDPRGKLHYNED